MNRKQVAQELVKIAKSITATSVVNVKEFEGRYEDFRKEIGSILYQAIEDAKQVIRQKNYEDRDLADVMYQRENLRPTEHKFTDEDKEVVREESKKRDGVKKDIESLIKLLKRQFSNFNN